MGVPFINNPYKEVTPQFPVPVVPPHAPVDFTPVSIDISCYWLAYLAGACRAFLQEDTWKALDLDDLNIVLAQAQDLLVLLEDAQNSTACGSLLPPIACNFDFPVSDGGWTVQRTAGWIPGLGWSSIPSTSGSIFLNGLWIYKTFTPVYVDRVEVDVSVGCGNTNLAAGTNNNVELSHSGGPTADFNELVNPCSTGSRTIVLTQPLQLCDRIDVFWYANYGDSAASSFVTVTAARLFGKGSTDPCS